MFFHFDFIFIIEFVMISTVGGEKNREKKKKKTGNKTGKKRELRHTMSTTQLLLSHAAVRVDIRSRDIRSSQSVAAHE